MSKKTQNKEIKVDLASLAAEEALSLQLEFPHLFSKLPINHRELIKALEWKLYGEKKALQRGLFKYNSENDDVKIYYDRASSTAIKRFAVAHEIGHAMLLFRHPDILDTLKEDAYLQEYFSSTFAGELLIPQDKRQELGTQFREAEVLDILRIANKVGLTPGALFHFARCSTTWLAGTDVIWMQVKYVNNRLTGRDPRLRIIAAFFDPDRFFVPRNKSVTGLIGSEDFLRGMLPGIGRSDMYMALFLDKVILNGNHRKYQKKLVQANISAVKLSPSKYDKLPKFIVRAEVFEEEQSQLKLKV